MSAPSSFSNMKMDPLTPGLSPVPSSPVQPAPVPVPQPEQLPTPAPGAPKFSTLGGSSAEPPLQAPPPLIVPPLPPTGKQ